MSHVFLGRDHVYKLKRSVRHPFGDMSSVDLIAKLPAILGGLGLAALGAKVDDAKVQTPAKPKAK